MPGGGEGGGAAARGVGGRSGHETPRVHHNTSCTRVPFAAADSCSKPVYCCTCEMLSGLKSGCISTCTSNSRERQPHHASASTERAHVQSRKCIVP